MKFIVGKRCFNAFGARTESISNAFCASAHNDSRFYKHLPQQTQDKTLYYFTNNGNKICSTNKHTKIKIQDKKNKKQNIHRYIKKLNPINKHNKNTSLKPKNV
ncbi:hypothetical protein AC477_04805 [miscellaneous Crenarchaeota group-1 archaeon SG8-32-1]|uniref:Uncharacterized protein n=1 Tax=miscellaneous Crenarchaeota group-1 archaeon SG8-32-1 TaxID=1685124 RepID=A0A0M0BQB2_9ARCH|nr:MAG: hypothetical protein AC477_04805 [miscellaneous Crenarchaeota group-1 archaeon SG8-32-1]